ncbi:MAG: hypothetical protein AAF743_10030 [Planctomycetota bacterium]
MTQDPNYDPNADPRHPGGFEPYQNTNYGNQTMPAPKNSVAAIVGLITGATSLIPCLGFITGPVGFVSSIVGFFTSGKPGVKGRWMAVLGLLLSLIGFIGVNVALVGGLGVWGVTKSMSIVSDPSEEFIMALVGNDIAAAKSAGSGFADADLESFATQLDAVGDSPEINFSLSGFNFQAINNEVVGNISGTVVGNGTTLHFSTEVEGNADLSGVTVTDMSLR